MYPEHQEQSAARVTYLPSNRSEFRQRIFPIECAGNFARGHRA